MTLDALRCFCAVIECRSFRAAAAQVFRSQPAVSQQIKALERELGERLVERKRCLPTGPGEALYARARRILNEADGLAAAVADAGSRPVRALRVGASDTTALYFLPGKVREFTRRHPSVNLHIVNRPSAALSELVLRGELDLALVTLPAPAGDLETRALFRQRFVLAVPARHPLARQGQTSLARLRREPFLLLDADTRMGSLLQAFFASEDMVPHAALHSGSFEVIKRYVAEGVGVGLLPAVAVTPQDRKIAVLHVARAPVVTIGLVWRKGALLTRIEEAFIEGLRTK